MIRIEVSYRAILFIALVLVSLWALTKLWPIILLILTAFIFHTALLPYVEWLVRKGLPRTLSVLLILTAMNRVVGGYIRGQVVTSACIFVYTLIVLLAVGVPNAVAFAVLAAFVDIIPLIGATIAVVFPTVAAFRESPTQAIIVLALLMAYQQFEDRLLTPRVYGQTLNLPPLVVLVAVLVGGQLLGIVGVLLAMPAAAVARVGFDYWMERRGPAAPPMGPIEELLAPDEPAME